MSTKIAPSPGHRTAPPSGDVRSIRACDYCRSLKVRCIAGNASSGKCQRCAKSGRDCIMTAPQKRKQRKRTDTRVTELEKEVRAMRVAFSQDEGASHQTNQEVNRQVCISGFHNIDKVLRGSNARCCLFVANHFVGRSYIQSNRGLDFVLRNGPALGKLGP
jgi:hypothetical protein